MSGEEKTARIIKALKQHQIPDAFFFVTTNNIRDVKAKQRLQEYAKAGYKLAHHSHAHLSASRSTVKAYLEDFDKASDLLHRLDNHIRYHRFPYLHYGNHREARAQIGAHVKKRGYQIGYVTVDNFDWYLNARLIRAFDAKQDIDFDRLGEVYVDTLWQGVEFYDDIAKKTLGRSPRHVLLLHENEMAALYLDKLLAHIKAKGWTLISPQSAYQDPIARVYRPEFSFNKQGRVAAIAHQEGMDKAALRHPRENTQYLDKVLADARVFRTEHVASAVDSNE